ncbi:MAG: hypothetical protein JSW66_02100 [Phycisphaerales bacterium]|nr:MAG: hypothetical protein JSW66_02100 [Phycisphaerales bacterium]
MSNRIDLYQSEQRQLALPAASFSIFVDGMLCPTLELIEIVRSGWPGFSWAKLAYNPAGHTASAITATEDIESELGIGKTLCVRPFYSDIPPGGAPLSFPIFHGHIESIETKLSGTDEWVEITARDYSANLQRVSIHGQRLARADGTNVFLAGLDTVFNPDGKANANPVPIETAGRIYTVFCAEFSQGRLWSCAEVIDYLLCEYVAAGLLHTPNLAQLKTLTNNYIVRDLDVTELNLAEALHRCCQSIGLKFKFVPRLVQTGPSEAIVFYTNATSRVVELTSQLAGQQLSLSKTNVAAMHSRKSFWPLTHRYTGQGDFRIYEATFELVKAWDENLEDIDYDKFSPSTNSDFYKVKDVYRKWSLNEAGLYSIAPYNRGAAFDFSKIFQSTNFIQHRRRFHPALTTDALGRSLGYFVQVSFDDGQSWWEYLHAFNVLLDECGIWLSSDQLDIDTWIAALRGFLRFRITASVVSDERLTCVVTDGPVNSTAPVVDHVITLPRQFKYRKVSGQSIFAGSTDETLGAPDEVDDSDALHEFVHRTIEASPEIIETIDVQTPSLMFDCQVGDRVSTSPESRDLLAGRSDNRSRSHISRVQMDFRQQCTNLKLVRWRGCR